MDRWTVLDTGLLSIQTGLLLAVLAVCAHRRWRKSPVTAALVALCACPAWVGLKAINCEFDQSLPQPHRSRIVKWEQEVFTGWRTRRPTPAVHDYILVEAWDSSQPSSEPVRVRVEDKRAFLKREALEAHARKLRNARIEEDAQREERP